MKTSQRQHAADLTLRTSGAILALLALAASVSAMGASSAAPAAIASMLVTTVEGAERVEREAASAAGQFAAAPSEAPNAGLTAGAPRTPRLDPRLTDLPPPGC